MPQIGVGGRRLGMAEVEAGGEHHRNGGLVRGHFGVDVDAIGRSDVLNIGSSFRPAVNLCCELPLLLELTTKDGWISSPTTTTASVISAAGGDDDGNTTDEEQEQEGGSRQTQPDGGGAGGNGDERMRMLGYDERYGTRRLGRALIKPKASCEIEVSCIVSTRQAPLTSDHTVRM